MQLDEALAELQSYGTAQNRKIYVRHGALADKVFGVSFANLNMMAKRIKRDHRLAERLWRDGNYDARNLAGKIADPSKMDAAELNEWARAVDNYLHGGTLGDLAARSPNAKQIINAWTAADKEFIKHAGYCALGALLKNDSDALADAETRRFLDAIEAEIHTSPNWARYGMNWALIAIGTYKATLTDYAVKLAERIGAVQVDHGQTNCKTPAAAPYIQKAAAHQRKMRAKSNKRK